MTGRNTMILNHETMLEALNFWLEHEIHHSITAPQAKALSVKQRGDKFHVETDGPLQPKHAVAQRTEQREAT